MKNKHLRLFRKVTLYPVLMTNNTFKLFWFSRYCTALLRRDLKNIKSSLKSIKIMCNYKKNYSIILLKTWFIKRCF